MSDIKKYKIDIKTLSPVHIGSGESYTAAEYVSGKAKGKNGSIPIFKRINLSKYFLSLDDDKKDDLISNLSNQNFSLKSFDDKISNDFKVYLSYDRCKEEIKPNQEIEENIKTLNELYIPGSSLKGAIKSALLYNSISRNDVPKIVRDVINKGRVNRWDYERFINDIFSSDTLRNKAQGSIMKFMQIADSNTAKVPAVYDVVSVMANERGQNQLYKRGTIVRSFLETIPPNKKLETTLTTNFNDETYAHLNLRGKNKFLDISHIKKSIYKFSKAYIDYELEFSKKYRINYLEKFYKSIKDKNTIDTPLLKIGAGSGFLATTIALKIKEYDEYEFEDYFERVRNATRGKSYSFEYPKSRKVISEGGKPLGWIQFAFEE